MMKKALSQKIDTVFVLIIFCVFAVSVLMVLMLGANIYQNVTETTQDGSDESLVLSFFWSRIKNDDIAGTISIGQFHGCPALFFDEEIDGVGYRTILYNYNGWLYELFSEKELDFYPEDGTQIISAFNLGFGENEYGMIRISIGSSSLLISPRGGAARALPGADAGEGGTIG